MYNTTASVESNAGRDIGSNEHRGYGSISSGERNFNLPTNQYVSDLDIENLLDLEERGVSMQFLDSSNNVMSLDSWFQDIARIAAISAFDHDPTQRRQIVPLAEELVDVWRIILAFILVMFGCMIFILIMVFVKVNTAS